MDTYLGKSLIAIVGYFLFGGYGIVNESQMNNILYYSFIKTFFPPGCNTDLIISSIIALLDPNLIHCVTFQDAEKKMKNDKFLGMPLSSYLYRICRNSGLSSTVRIITNFKKYVHKMTCEEYCQKNEMECEDGYENDHYFGCIRDNERKEKLYSLRDLKSNVWTCVVISGRHIDFGFRKKTESIYCYSKINIDVIDSKISDGLIPAPGCKPHKITDLTIYNIADIYLHEKELFDGLTFVKGDDKRNNIRSRLNQVGYK